MSILAHLKILFRLMNVTLNFSFLRRSIIISENICCYIFELILNNGCTLVPYFKGFAFDTSHLCLIQILTLVSVLLSVDYKHIIDNAVDPF